MGILLINKIKNIHLGSRSKNLLMGSGLMAMSTLFGAFARMLLISLLARIYSKEQFGLWVSITSISAVMVTSDFGIGNALRNKLSELNLKGEYQKARNYFFSVLYFFLGIVVLASIVLILFQSKNDMSFLFKTDDIELKREGAVILVSVEILFLLGVPLGIGSTMFFAYQESKNVAVLNIANALLSTAAIGTCAFLGFSIKFVAILYFVISLAINGAGTILFLKNRGWSPIFLRAKTVLSNVWELLLTSFNFAILQVSGAFIFNAVTLVATAQVGLAGGAELNLTQKLYAFGLSIFLSFYNPLWAGYSDAIHRKDYQWCNSTLLRAGLITTVVFLGVTVIITLWGNYILPILGGKEYTGNRLLFFSVGLWALFYSLYSIGVAFLSATGKISIISVSTTIFAFLFVPISKLYTPKYGVNAISFISVITFVLLTLIVYLQSFTILRKLKSI